MSQLAENTRSLYQYEESVEYNRSKAFHSIGRRELQWEEELSAEGVEYKPSLGSMIAPSMALSEYPPPPCNMDLALWFSDKIMESGKRFVIPTFQYRFVIGRGFGVKPGLYEGFNYTVAEYGFKRVYDKEDLWRQYEAFERAKGRFVAVQHVRVEHIYPGTERLNGTSMDGHSAVLVRGVVWKDDYDEEARDDTQWTKDLAPIK